MKKLPKKIYVQLEVENSGSTFLNAYENPADFSDDGKVGIYELKEVKNRRTETIIE